MPDDRNPDERGRPDLSGFFGDGASDGLSEEPQPDEQEAQPAEAELQYDAKAGLDAHLETMLSEQLNDYVLRALGDEQSALFLSAKEILDAYLSKVPEDLVEQRTQSTGFVLPEALHDSVLQVYDTYLKELVEQAETLETISLATIALAESEKIFGKKVFKRQEKDIIAKAKAYAESALKHNRYDSARDALSAISALGGRGVSRPARGVIQAELAAARGSYKEDPAGAIVTSYKLAAFAGMVDLAVPKQVLSLRAKAAQSGFSTALAYVRKHMDQPEKGGIRKALRSLTGRLVPEDPQDRKERLAAAEKERTKNYQPDTAKVAFDVAREYSNIEGVNVRRPEDFWNLPQLHTRRAQEKLDREREAKERADKKKYKPKRAPKTGDFGLASTINIERGHEGTYQEEPLRSRKEQLAKEHKAFAIPLSGMSGSVFERQLEALETLITSTYSLKDTYSAEALYGLLEKGIRSSGSMPPHQFSKRGQRIYAARVDAKLALAQELIDRNNYLVAELVLDTTEHDMIEAYAGENNAISQQSQQRIEGLRQAIAEVKSPIECKFIEDKIKTLVAQEHRGEVINPERYEEALVCCDYLISVNPEDRMPYQTKGTTLLLAGRLDEAIDTFREALNKANAAYDLAVEAALRASQSPPQRTDEDLYYIYAYALVQRGKPSDANPEGRPQDLVDAKSFVDSALQNDPEFDGLSELAEELNALLSPQTEQPQQPGADEASDQPPQDQPPDQPPYQPPGEAPDELPDFFGIGGAESGQAEQEQPPGNRVDADGALAHFAKAAEAAREEREAKGQTGTQPEPEPEDVSHLVQQARSQSLTAYVLDTLYTHRRSFKGSSYVKNSTGAAAKKVTACALRLMDRGCAPTDPNFAKAVGDRLYEQLTLDSGTDEAEFRKGIDCVVKTIAEKAAAVPAYDGMSSDDLQDRVATETLSIGIVGILYKNRAKLAAFDYQGAELAKALAEESKTLIGRGTISPSVFALSLADKAFPFGKIKAGSNAEEFRKGLLAVCEAVGQYAVEHYK